MRRKHILEKLIENADLPGEALPYLPLVELAGDNRVLIENHLGVAAYEPQMICVTVRYGCLRICGKHLSLSRMTKDQLVIFGQVDTVTLIRKGK